ncbi:transketolase [Herbaspirillum sp. RTI4]|uniref:transketolase family protein n=1 Tax=Herbaspirillum sp. RTI4 TaxID=3048640 RepID=UPI002AB5AABE|nr:transketolase [Herbaspirillum sp. RTI4]MDY7577593.1 transketolase [Herbaspirillum sp. RTI4]MEA9983394.1 transketolase [Herbaspirillum sp. RTI4]
MRKQLCDALVARSVNQKMVFLTGDLGFMALEPLQTAMGSRFINAGVAEQNMISVAAALARQELDVWAYSIAPFIYARPFEQIRNDIAFHNLPVKLIGNGGGYGYGVMGPTHHAIDDYGVLLTLPNMSVYIPVFDEDMAAVVERAGDSGRPSYIRTGRGEPPKSYSVPAYAPWRQLTQGGGPVVIAVGPLAGIYIEAIEQQAENLRPRLWAVAELPIDVSPLPVELLAQIEGCSSLCVAEEHVRRGGFGSELLLHLAGKGIAVKKFSHLYAKAHHYERYGSQAYLRRQSGLDVDSLLVALKGA